MAADTVSRCWSMCGFSCAAFIVPLVVYSRHVTLMARAAEDIVSCMFGFLRQFVEISVR